MPTLQRNPQLASILKLRPYLQGDIATCFHAWLRQFEEEKVHGAMVESDKRLKAYHKCNIPEPRHKPFTPLTLTLIG